MRKTTKAPAGNRGVIGGTARVNSCLNSTEKRHNSQVVYVVKECDTDKARDCKVYVDSRGDCFLIIDQEVAS